MPRVLEHCDTVKVGTVKDIHKTLLMLASFSVDLGAVVIDAKPAKIKGLAHREGRTRSLQIRQP